MIAASRKPNSVSTFRWMTVIPLAPPSLAGSSNRPGSIGRAVLLPYLVLLRAGFCLPRVLPPARCALTAPFHHCHPLSPLSRLRRRFGCMFSVPLSFGLPRPGVTRRTALRSSDFPPERPPESDHATVWLTAIVCTLVPSHRSPARSGTAPASCTDCCAACRWPRRSSRCSTHSRAACRRGTRARRCL